MQPTAETAVSTLLSASVFRPPMLRRELSSSIFNRIKRVCCQIDPMARKNVAVGTGKTSFQEVSAQ